MIPQPLYFESHVTIDPVAEETRLQEFADICQRFRFKAAKLFMQKGKELVPSDLDQFCTRRDPVVPRAMVDETQRAYDNSFAGTRDLVAALEKAGFHVRRHKIEAALTDSKLPKFAELQNL